MSKKLTGNGLWESSRMMLPEHKETINKYLGDHKLKTRPEIHEDEWEIMLSNLNQSYIQKDEIKVELFGKFNFREVVGVVTAFNQYQKKFKVEFDDGFEWVDYSEVVSVTLL
jgi:hypothetical protein